MIGYDRKTRNVDNKFGISNKYEMGKANKGSLGGETNLMYQRMGKSTDNI